MALVYDEGNDLYFVTRTNIIHISLTADNNPRLFLTNIYRRHMYIPTVQNIEYSIAYNNTDKVLDPIDVCDDANKIVIRFKKLNSTGPILHHSHDIQINDGCLTINGKQYPNKLTTPLVNYRDLYFACGNIIYELFYGSTGRRGLANHEILFYNSDKNYAKNLSDGKIYVIDKKDKSREVTLKTRNDGKVVIDNRILLWDNIYIDFKFIYQDDYVIDEIVPDAAICYNPTSNYHFLKSNIYPDIFGIDYPKYTLCPKQLNPTKSARNI